MKTIKVLLLENDSSDAELIANELRSSGLPIDITQVRNKADFFKVYNSMHPELVLSDYMIDGRLSGVQIMHEVRQKNPDQPFIFVSWEIHDASVIEVLRAGATDYVFKEQLSRLTLSVHRALQEAAERAGRERAKNELRNSEEYFRSLIENASDIILVLDGQAIIRYASPSVKKLLGYDTSEFVGKSLLDFIHSEDRENAVFVLTGKKDKREFSLEFRFQNREGSWRGLEAIGRMMETGDESIQIVINARDITDRVLEQEALRESIIRHLKTQTELQKAQQKVIQQERMAAIGQMASGIAHDFSNALMPVLGFSEILLNRPETMKELDRVKKYIEMINTSARDAMNIVGGLREFYRARDKTENILPMSVNKAIEQAVMLTQPKWQGEARSKGANIQIVMKLEPLPETVGNEASLREALTNLIFNAVDAMPEGGKLTFASRLDDQVICVDVSDSGIGMDEQTRQRCFEPFFSTKGKGGTGLGLSMVYGVIRRHEGTIDIKSQKGTGTTFMIRLPVKKAEKPIENGVPPAPAVVKAIRKLAVLVVDDEAMVRDVLSEYLSGDGHKVHTANDGREALEIFKKNSFDLVITDRAMPEMNGDQLTLAIKQISPKMPLVMLTGFGELMKAKGEHPAGVDYLLSKPLTFEAYREVIAKVS